jgi:hypothetical protein
MSRCPAKPADMMSGLIRGCSSRFARAIISGRAIQRPSVLSRKYFDKVF